MPLSGRMHEPRNRQGMTKSPVNMNKVVWAGRVMAVQPRIRLTRSFDERYHDYQGYVIYIEGTCGEESGVFMVAVGEVAHERHQFHTGMELSGVSAPVEDPRREMAAFYKTSGIRIEVDAVVRVAFKPPFQGIPPDLPTYRSRGHRRLDPRTYESKCLTCIWGCKMPVEIILDQWNPSKKKYRFETFCYGPKSCPFYRAGVTRKVPGRKGMIWEEENWIDEEATSHRAPDE
jgi:hypothetical protein